MSTQRAITFGVKYENEPHPAGDWIKPGGYIVVEAVSPEQLFEFLPVILGHDELEIDGKTYEGGVRYAFDYDVKELEASETAREAAGERLFYPLGRLAEFTTLPQPSGSIVKGATP